MATMGGCWWAVGWRLVDRRLDQIGGWVVGYDDDEVGG